MNARFENENQFIKWNEEMANKYDPEAYHLRSHFIIRWIERRRVKAILRFLQITEQDDVLEVGCGAGNVLEQIPNERLFGIDLSTFLLEKARVRLNDRSANLIQANAERLPIEKRQFHAIVCTEVLEHVTDPRQVLFEMARVSKPNAVLVVSIPNEVWIDRVKKVIRKLNLSRWLLGGNKKGYRSPNQMTDEWHLHIFELGLFREISKGILMIRNTKAIPFALIPLRYVICCQVSLDETNHE